MKASRKFSLTARLYRTLAFATVRAKMQYRLDFISSTLLQAATGLYDFLFIAAILHRLGTVAGWDVWEVGLLYAVSRIGWGLYRLFLEEVDQFEKYIVSGDYDIFLTRPWPGLFTLIARNLELARLSWVIQGILVGGISATHLLERGTISWTAIPHLVGACIWSTMLYSAVGIATSSAAFAITRIEELQVFTENATGTASLYPLEVYPNWLSRIILWVVPLAMGNYIPVRYVLGKGGTWASIVLAGAVSVASMCVALKLWHWGESRYRSTGT